MPKCPSCRHSWREMEDERPTECPRCGYTGREDNDDADVEWRKDTMQDHMTREALLTAIVNAERIIRGFTEDDLYRYVGQHADDAKAWVRDWTEIIAAEQAVEEMENV